MCDDSTAAEGTRLGVKDNQNFNNTWGCVTVVLSRFTSLVAFDFFFSIVVSVSIAIIGMRIRKI